MEPDRSSPVIPALAEDWIIQSLSSRITEGDSLFPEHDTNVPTKMIKRAAGRQLRSLRIAFIDAGVCGKCLSPDNLINL